MIADVRSAAERDGVRIELADLGDWGAATCIAEYDPAGPAIRVNTRAIERYRAARGELSSCDVRALIDYAVAHEWYHHRQHTGDVPVQPTHAEREAAADAFARACAGDPDVIAFVSTGRA